MSDLNSVLSGDLDDDGAGDAVKKAFERKINGVPIEAWEGLGVYFDAHDEVDVPRTVRQLCRIMSRGTDSAPVVDTATWPLVHEFWTGTRLFSAGEIQASLFHFDLEVPYGKIKDVLKKLVRSGVIVGNDAGFYQFRSNPLFV